MDSNIPNPPRRITRKPSFKNKPVPQVRQTLTSYHRMVKANPLLLLDKEDIEKLTSKTVSGGIKSQIASAVLPSHQNSHTTSSTAFKKPILLSQYSLKHDKPSVTDITKKHPNLGLNNQTNAKASVKNGAFRGHRSTKPPVNTQQEKTSRIKNVQFFNVKPRNKQVENLNCKKLDLALEVQKSKPQERNVQAAISKMNLSKSAECLNKSNSDFEGTSPIEIEGHGTHRFRFKTPTAYRRRSRSFVTPQSNTRTTLFRVSTPAPSNLQKLQERLSKWLQSRGKPPALFHHLRSFAVETMVSEQDDNKENLDNTVDTSGSYENLNILPLERHITKDIDKKTSDSEFQHVKEALNELLKLIEEDYPANQCSSWLQMIKDKCPEIINEPVYWECRAGVEQSMGNVHNAVEYYKEAIIQGAEVSTVNNSLDQLLKKFSLLNINSQPELTTVNKISKDKIVAEARNVFISSIINFAVYKRSVNTKSSHSEKMYAIPVRRSTRLSKSGYTSTPGVQLCRSLRDLDNSEDISFQLNNALC